MLTIIGTIVSVLNGLFTLVGNLFGKKTDNTQDAASDAVKQSNDAGKIAADAARTTESEQDAKIAQIVRDDARNRRNYIGAGSVREQNQTIANAISDANKDTDSNG